MEILTPDILRDFLYHEDILVPTISRDNLTSKKLKFLFSLFIIFIFFSNAVFYRMVLIYGKKIVTN